MDNASDEVSGGQKPAIRMLLKVLASVFVFALLLPFVLGKTSLRDFVLNSLVDSDKLTLQSTDASLGYFSPTSVSGLKLQTIDQKSTVSFQEIAADRSWFSMLLSRPDLGNFRFVKPDVDITVVKNATQETADVINDDPGSVAPLLPNLTAQIVDAHVLVRVKPDEPPPIDISGLNAQVRLKRQDNLSILILEPALVFDHQPLTPQLCGQGLQLIAPLLADEVSAAGEFSLNLTKCEIPVGATAVEKGDKALATQISGQLDLHSATVSMKNTLASNALDAVMKLAGINLPGALTVAENVTVDFSVIDGRVHHSGLALILPQGDRSIEIVSSGSVGLDETLDLTVSIKLPEGLLGKGAVRDALTSQPIQLAVTGTLEAPKLSVSSKQGILQSFGKLLESTGKDSSESNPGEVGDALSDILGDVLNLAQERKQKKQAAESQAPTGTEGQEPNAGRTPLLPRLREKEGGRGLLPRRNRSNQPDPRIKNPKVDQGVPQPPEPGIPSSSVPTPI
ncbi:MAG: hypothetical protein GY924_22000 [Planctomycetaceae bacterium]|nr:hypothetical protein [Planctomycetaceae bacterium]